MASSTPAVSPVIENGHLSERIRKLIGTTIGGRYKVLSLIGEGGMGAVLLVEHILIRKRMAIKVLNDAMMKNPEAVARFEREALAAAHIEHPNVVAATDSGRTEDGALFVVFEYVDGHSLRDRIGTGPLPPVLATHIVRQVAGALMRAHGLGVIHRDLKPENIMLVARDGDDNLAKVLDFGLAKLSTRAPADSPAGLSAGEALTRYGAVFGTPAYMAPEQAAGGEVDGRTDLYALGVLFYEMLSGTLPFDGDDSAAFLRHHIVDPIPLIHTRVPGLKIPEALEAIMMRLLEKRPDKRYDSAKSLLDAIDHLIASNETLKYDPSSPLLRMRPAPIRGPSSDANQKATAIAPSDLPARKFSPFSTAETQFEDGHTKSQEKIGENGESLALALQDLNQLAAMDRAGDGPTINGLAKQFGAQPLPGGGAPISAVRANALGEPSEPPKLRAPSALNIQVLQPEGANSAVLIPAPPPTFSERVRETGVEAAGWWRSVGWPTTKRVAQKVWQTLATYTPIYFARIVAFVRTRLPKKHREMSERWLRLAVGAVLCLPFLILFSVLIFSGGDSASTRPATTALPGFATDREMERGVSGGPRDLEKLSVKYPNDSRIFRALVRAHGAHKNYANALAALSRLVTLDPTMAADDEMGQIAAAAALLPDTSDAAIALLEKSLGDKGISVLADLAEKTTMEPWKSKLAASLQKATVRALASPATLILIDLRSAARCEDKRGLLSRASQKGDLRTLTYLQSLQPLTGCGPGGQNDCWTCLRKGNILQQTLDALQKRLFGG